MSEWQDISKVSAPTDRRILVYSETMLGDTLMRFRIMDGRFVCKCSEITHWKDLIPPANRGDV